MRLNRPLLSAAALLILAVGVYAVVLWRSHTDHGIAVDQLLAEVDTALATRQPDGSELSRLVAKLSGLETRDRRIELALARIELARGHAERAARHLEPLVQGGAAQLPELRTAAAAALSWQARGGKDAAERRALGRQALDLAESACALSDGAAGDLFLAWQAAVRLPDDAASERHAAALRAKHADSLEARTVQQALFGLEQPLAPVAALAAEWPEPPVEIRLLHAVLLLAGTEVSRAQTMLDDLLAEAPNLLEVRNFAAAAHDAAARAAADEAERERHLQIRDEQIAWLDANAPADDVRRPRWLAMRQR